MGARFWLLLVGQTGALLGAGLTAFALGLWSLSFDGSNTRFALLAAASMAPGVLIAPFAAGLAERARPRRALFWANGLGTAGTVVVVAGLSAGLTPGAWVFGALVVSGIGFGLQWPVYARALVRLTATTTERARAAALLQLGPVAQHIVAPVVATALLSLLQTRGVLALDVVLGVVAMVTAAAAGDDGDDVDHHGEDGGGFGEAIAFVRARPALWRLPLFFLASYFFGAVLQALSTPLLLSLVGRDRAGLLLTLSGTGMVAGVVVAWRVVVKARVRAVVAFEAVGGVCLLAIGLFPTPLALTSCAALFLLFMSLSNAVSQAAWQDAVPARLQVRVFALRRTIAFTAFPLCFFVFGPVADHAVVVTGDVTRGLAVAFFVAGAGKIAVSLIALRRRTLQSIDIEQHP